MRRKSFGSRRLGRFVFVADGPRAGTLEVVANASCPEQVTASRPARESRDEVVGRAGRQFRGSSRRKCKQGRDHDWRGAAAITASGVPKGGAAGYHPADPSWRETPASQWGLDFQSAAFGPTMVISTSKEISYIHHHYYLDQIRLTVPEGVRVIKENRTLTGKSESPSGPFKACSLVAATEVRQHLASRDGSDRERPIRVSCA